MEIAVEAGVDPQLALRHGELLQVAVESEGSRPVQPDGRQITVHREGRHVLGGCGEERGWDGYLFVCFQVPCDWWFREGPDKPVTFAECGERGPVGGSAAHVVEAGGSELIAGVGLET